ncbi:HEAT repeat domain-containing protein [Leeuwenhoekiella nanhaiensis]|uniref:HEAT repeat domain-containing protein n=1 Tax=Leeuwenhoekiella nanhaiensis TaxID=1655491 RepID=A0A2G1VPS1_9FLAO|nr:HEAT repeat domain-containing protein [Leeuwenhoekiella nanhaiensis]PHQ28766.1 hypothetical protein CJ305_13185 [Leeuwenhoekiella nanhaiensis]
MQLNSLKELENWPYILKVNLTLSISFLILTLLFIALVLVLRIVKNRREAYRIKFDVKLIDFYNHFLFDEDFEKASQLGDFKFRHLKTSFDHKLAIKQTLIFDENLKGESSEAIKELFYGLGLYAFLLKDLKKKAWFKQVRALYAFSKLGISVPQELVAPLIKSKKVELRQQAMLYFLNTSKENPLGFLDDLDQELTLWQQVFIENSLKNFDLEVPDFARWFNHEKSSVVVFCIKMVVSFNQFQNIPLLIEALDHTEAAVRAQAINSLKIMEVPDALQLMSANFPFETPANKRAILYAIERIGTAKDLRTLVGCISKEEENLQIDYYKIASSFEDEIPVQKLIDLDTITEDWEEYKDYSLRLLQGA